MFGILEGILQAVQGRKESGSAKSVQEQKRLITLSELLGEWQKEELLQSALAIGTMNNYNSSIRMLQRMELAEKTLEEITEEDLQVLFNRFSTGYWDRDGNWTEGYSHSHILSFSAVLHGAFRYAVCTKKYIHANPMDPVTMHRGNRREDLFGAQEEHKKASVLTMEQFHRIEALLGGRKDPALLPMQIAFYTGLRLGEVCGLAWPDIDLKEKYLIVRRSVVLNRLKGNRLEFTAPKRGKVRIVEFGETLAAILQEAARVQERNEKELGDEYILNYYDTESIENRLHYVLCKVKKSEKVTEGYQRIRLVCLRPDGAYESRRTVSCTCSRLKHQLEDMEDFHFHMLRHTYATMLLEKGAAPKEVQELLGHSDIRTTMNVYAHGDREEKRRIVRLLDGE